MATKKERNKVKKEGVKKVKVKTARKAVKMTVRNIIEMLAKGNWDDEITCINEVFNDLHHTALHRKQVQHKIVSISQSSQYGTEIVFVGN